MKSSEYHSNWIRNGRQKAITIRVEFLKSGFKIYYELIESNPIGKSSRSNPVTYLKAYDDIRDLLQKQKSTKVQGLKPKHFLSTLTEEDVMNAKEGVITVSMQFMADY